MTEGRTLEDVVADLVPLAEAAHTLGIEPNTALRMAKRGKFPGDAARKEGRRWVVSVRKLDHYFHGEG